jgi:hypothetical protein
MRRNDAVPGPAPADGPSSQDALDIRSVFLPDLLDFVAPVRQPSAGPGAEPRRADRSASAYRRPAFGFD